MNFKPLTKRQARSVAKAYQSLVGQCFDRNGLMCEIECVAVAPYDEINKWIFTQYYTELRSAEEAMVYYSGHFFDVLVLARAKNSELYSYKDIKSYLLEFNLGSIPELAEGA